MYRALQMLVLLGLWPAVFACASCLGVIEAGLPAMDSQGLASDLRTSWGSRESEHLACDVQGQISLRCLVCGLSGSGSSCERASCGSPGAAAAVTKPPRPAPEGWGVGLLRGVSAEDFHPHTSRPCMSRCPCARHVPWAGPSLQAGSALVAWCPDALVGGECGTPVCKGLWFL